MTDQRTSLMTRRQLLSSLALAPAAALGGCATAGVGARASLTHGSLVTEVTSRSTLVWHRTSGARRMHVEYATSERFDDVRATPATTSSAETDYTVVVELDGLAPGREYFYRGVVDGADGRAAVGRFRTAPASREPFTFAWSADIEAGHQPFTLFDQIARKRPAFFLLLGDTIYADVPKARFTPTLRGYRYKHRENRADPHLQQFLRDTPVFAIWDDHEVENDFNATNPYIADGRRAFRDYWPIRSDDPTVLYRTFSWGPLADFFVLDCRQYRTPQSDAAGPAKTMLGARQKAWLKERLAASRAPLKFLVSSVPFIGTWGADKWSGYAVERAELQYFVQDQGITGVIVLSGDIHAARDLTAQGFREFVAGPIAAWPLCTLSADVRARWDRAAFFHVCDTFTYGVVTVRTDGAHTVADVQILDAADTVRHRVTVRAPTRS